MDTFLGIIGVIAFIAVALWLLGKAADGILGGGKSL